MQHRHFIDFQVEILVFTNFSYGIGVFGTPMSLSPLEINWASCSPQLGEISGHQPLVRTIFLVDLHRSKPLILLVTFNLHFHCFQGQGHNVMFSQPITNNLSNRCRSLLQFGLEKDEQNKTKSFEKVAYKHSRRYYPVCAGFSPPT